MTLNPNDLAKGMEKIADEIFKHCQHGKQSQPYNANGSLSCGQFYGDSVKERVQCGLHGAASAISILLLTRKTNHADVAKKLLKFTKEFNNNNQKPDDELNTIKQAEILAAINDLAEEPNYPIELKNKLINKQDCSSGAWAYFLDEQKVSEVATCYVVLALNGRLASDSEVLIKAQNFLWKSQCDLLEQSKASDIYAIAIRSLILYTLAKCNLTNSGISFSKKELNSSIVELWNICRPQYKSQFEVTVEYDRNDKNQYLRLPWQIYLANAVILANSSYYYTINFQKYLSVLYKAAQAGGYKYDHAGKFFSTRTNAILYSFLDSAYKSNPKKYLLNWLRDQFLEAWAKNYIRTGAVFVLGLAFLSWSNQWKDILSEQSQFWGDFIGAIVISGLSWLFSMGRR
jgi:hypothetical protein